MEEYMVVKNYDFDLFIKETNSLLRQGWQLKGDVKTESAPGGAVLWYREMVKSSESGTNQCVVNPLDWVAQLFTNIAKGYNTNAKR